MKAADTSPGSEVAQVFVGAVCGVLVACMAMLVWLYVDDRPAQPQTVEIARVLDPNTTNV